MFEYRLVDTSTETSGDVAERVAEMEQIANEMGRAGWRWAHTSGPLMVFERAL